MAITYFRRQHGFLSNFWSCSFSWRGKTWRTSEHAYQAAKCQLEEDIERIAAADTPSDAKSMGRYVQKLHEFESKKVDIMREILQAKFGQNSSLAAKLVETGDEELIEANNWGDTFWGQVGGEGENWLGRLLMETRERLRKELNADNAK